MRVLSILWTAAQEFMFNTPLHGYRHIVENDHHIIEKIVWVLVQILATYGVVTSIFDVYYEYLSTPTVTTVESNKYPVWNVPFPGVAICNNNQLSKLNTHNKASQILAGNAASGYTEEEIFALLRYAGRIYNHRGNDQDNVAKLHDLLSPYDIDDFMAQLSPNCSSLLLRCMWRGRIKPCDTLFRTINTINGLCCAFNVILPSDSSKTKSERATSPGHKMGLSVVLNPEPWDYYYPLIPIYGTKILVFNPRNLPDTRSGLSETVVPLDMEMFMSLSAMSRFTVPELQSISPESRGCFFQEESDKKQGHYSYGRCLSQCRTFLIQELCGCLPSYYHTPDQDSVRVCDLNDIPCLHSNMDSFHHRHQANGLLSSDTPECENCLPCCSETWYSTHSSTSSIKLPLYHRSKIIDGLNLTVNHSIIHLYYGSVDSTLYKQDILYSWFELVSNFGGICSLFNGFSFVSVMEFLYYFSIRIFFIVKDSKTTTTTADSGARPQEVSGKSKTVYWNEISPRY